ncbi:hypothetical protein DXG01_005500 [Tephrocybe rancida]|nr:hypothetical protein DXG01_005500 [Tephrocybe rancida]
MSGTWEVRLSSSKGVPYFFNPTTRESSWDPPAGLTPDEIARFPGATEYLSGRAAKKESGGGKAGQVRAAHLLVKHKDSRRPSSWKEVRFFSHYPPTRMLMSVSIPQENITRTKAEAIEILKGYQATIAGSAEKFHELAQKHSDCSSHSSDGDLGWFGRGQMQKPFEDAAFELRVGEMSDIISTDSGVHLVLRTG